jgi:signal transduction histidine kinase/CheY-like chemotaxis protein
MPEKESMKGQPLILVVDDEPEILALVQEILGDTGHVEVAAGGQEALAKLKAHSYDLVLTDMMMPEMSGMELVQYLRLNQPEVLVIVFTGYANYQDAVDAVKLGAFDYLAKPLQAEMLRHAIERALEYQRLTRSQRDLETVFQGAEALGWQAVELVSNTAEAGVLSGLKERLGAIEDQRQMGQAFLLGAREVLKVTNSSIFLFDQLRGQFWGLAALGPEAEAKAGAMIAASEGLMGYVATHRRPLLVPDLTRDRHLPSQSRRGGYQTNSCMIIPLTGRKFWGVVNLADREDGQPFGPRDLFLGWLMGRLLVETLEAREEPQEELGPRPAAGALVSEAIPMGMAFLDQEHRIMKSNPALGRLLAPEGRELQGEEVFSRLGLSTRDREKLEAAFQQVLARQEPREFVPLKSRLGGQAPKFLAVRLVPLPGGDGASQVLLLAEDVSELERLRQRLNIFEHLAVMGKLTLCVAHELNNPLDGIRRYLSLALIKKEEPELVERYLTEAQKGLHKMSLSIKSLMFSVNPFKAPPRASDKLHNLLQDAIKIMMFQASDQRVQVSYEPPAEFSQMTVEADLYYVFINIIKNALQAMPQGGRLRVDGALEDSQVEISFQDTGPGLTPEELDKVFQPFYSTKEGVQGLGLGLPICQKILERYSGRLWVESHPGQGTKVRLAFPYEGIRVSDGQ